MTITTQISSDNKTVTIKIDGRFDFSTQRDFREAYRNQTAPGIHFQIDLGKTEYMDSSALGMLLLLKEHAENHKGTVILQHPSGDIKKILEIANFKQQFNIN